MHPSTSRRQTQPHQLDVLWGAVFDFRRHLRRHAGIVFETVVPSHNGGDADAWTETLRRPKTRSQVDDSGRISGINYDWIHIQ